jgi:hypothetical protein
MGSPTQTFIQASDLTEIPHDVFLTCSSFGGEEKKEKKKSCYICSIPSSSYNPGCNEYTGTRYNFFLMRAILLCTYYELNSKMSV